MRIKTIIQKDSLVSCLHVLLLFDLNLSVFVVFIMWYSRINISLSPLFILFPSIALSLSTPLSQVLSTLLQYIVGELFPTIELLLCSRIKFSQAELWKKFSPTSSLSKYPPALLRPSIQLLHCNKQLQYQNIQSNEP